MSNVVSNCEASSVNMSSLEVSSLGVAASSDSLCSPKSSDGSKKSPGDSGNRRKRKPKKVTNIEGKFNDDIDMTDVSLQNINPAINAITSKEIKTDSDDCETIDKIAQMVSNFTSSTPLRSSPSAVQSQNQNSIAPQQQLSSPSEVENRLEEMFSEPKLPLHSLETTQKNDISSNHAEQQQSQRSKPRQKSRKKQQDTNGKRSKKNSTIVNGKSSKNDKPTGSPKKGGKDKDDDVDRKKGRKSKENVGKSKIKVDVAPYLQIQNDGSFNIINQTVNGEDDGEKLVGKTKKSGVTTTERYKGIRGLHVSTLSNKYDLEKRDVNWVCVFCKLGPHKNKLGDLFGPYIINTNSKEYSFCLEDPANDIFRQSNRNKFAPVTQTPTKKKRKNSDNSRKLGSPSTNISSTVSGPDVNDEVFNGMTQLDEQSFEIWFHEDCIVWSPGTHIIGTKIIGLEQAVWQSTRYRCLYCQKNGAMISCLTRGCHKEAHIVCAKKNWKLCDDFKTYCEQHGHFD